MFDLAAVLGSKRELRRALNEVEILRFRDRLSLADLVARYPRRAGAATIRALLGEWNLGETATRSVLEERFLDFVHQAGLPAPELNALVAGGNRRLEVDFVWRRQRLIVELDGHAAHGTRHSFENDRERDRVLQAAGWNVVRVTWRQCTRPAPRWRATWPRSFSAPISRRAACRSPRASRRRPPAQE